MKKAFNICVAVVDIALLVVILTSAFSKKEENSSYSGYGSYGGDTSASSDYDRYSDDSEVSSGDTYSEAASHGTGTASAGSDDWWYQGEGSEEGNLWDESEETGLLEESSDVSQGLDDSYLAERDGKNMTMEDFEWYTKGILVDWIPENAVNIEDYEALKGTWRGYMNYDPKNETGSEGDFLIYVDISGEADNITVTFDWYWLHFYADPEGGSLDDSENSYFYGSFADNQIHAETKTGGKLDFKYFLNYDGYDHIIGTMEGNDGTQAIIAMIKP